MREKRVFAECRSIVEKGTAKESHVVHNDAHGDMIIEVAADTCGCWKGNLWDGLEGKCPFFFTNFKRICNRMQCYTCSKSNGIRG